MVEYYVHDNTNTLFMRRINKISKKNTTLATMEEYCNGLFINKAKEKKITEKYVKELATKTPSNRPAGSKPFRW